MTAVATPAQAASVTAPDAGASSASEAAIPPAADAVAAPVDRLAAAKAAVAKGREGAKRAERLRAEYEQSRRQNEQASQEIARLRQENQQRAEREAAILKDPLQAYRLAGKTPAETKAALERAGTVEGTIDELKAQLMESNSKREALENSIKLEKQQAQLANAESAFKAAASDAKTYPVLARQKPEIVLVVAKDLLARAQANTGHTYSDAEVLAYLNSNWEAQKQAASPTEVAAASAATGQASDGSTPPRTMTNGLGSKGYTLPKDFDDMPDAEQKEHLAKMLAAASK